MEQNVRSDGELVWVSWTNVAILDAAGAFIEILSIGNDVTGLVLAEQALKSREKELEGIVSPFLKRVSNIYRNLTPSEMWIADLVRQGKTSKEIADLINLSPRTIEFHRDNIRKKMGLKNKKINLRSHLLTFQ